MKITKSQLKQIIMEELSAVTEDKQAHIAGIVKKIVRLKQAILNAEKGMANMTAGAVDDMDLQDIITNNVYWAKQAEVMNLNDKIELLKQQLDQLRQDTPGQLERGLEESNTLGHKASRKLSRVGIAHESEEVRKEIMDMILGLDTGDEQDAETLANMAAYLKDASATNVRQGLGLEEKKDHPGETCKQAHPDESHKEWEEPSMKLSTPKIDPTSTSPKSRRQRAGGQGKRK